MTSMKAAMLHGVREPRVEETPIPTPGPGEVQIRIRAHGVCPSDLRAYLGTRAMALPRTPGHEWAGDAAALGEGGAGPRVGDPVEQVTALTDGRGDDIGAVGHPTAIARGPRMAGINGRVNLFAGAYPPPALPMDPNPVHDTHLVLTGSHDVTPHHVTLALTLIRHGIIRVAPLISNTYSLDDIVAAFEQPASRRGLKSMARIA